MKFRSTGGRLFRRCLTRTNEYQLDNLIFKLQMEHRVRAAANCPQPLKEEYTMTKVEKAVQWMEAIAADNTHGYSTVKRWGPDYDCSSFVISAFEQAGIPVKTKGASFTGNIKAIFTSLGFKDVTNNVDRKTGAGMLRGDVLLNTLFHVAVSQGNGKLVHARSNDGHFASGDQSGKEIVKDQAYFNYPWNYILRYTGEEDATGGSPVLSDPGDNADTPIEETMAYWPPRQIRRGMKGGDVAVAQAILNARGYDCGKIDGDFGVKTHNMTMAFQGESDLEIDGIIGPATWKALVSL